MVLNSNIKERKLGFLFLGIWVLILVFYLTWDGWLFEWSVYGLNGSNQHFDIDIFDMNWEFSENGKAIYHSTNNLHNILFLCYYQFFLGWMGLITGKEVYKQGAMALLALSVGATVATLDPQIHLCPVQIAYDIVHLSGIVIAMYFFYHCELDLKKATTPIFFTWFIYILSRIMVSKWPYWENPHAYYSINQINEMPFDAYGLEYVLAIILIYGFGKLVIICNEKTTKKWLKSFIPVAIFTIFNLLLLAIGLVEVQQIDMVRK